MPNQTSIRIIEILRFLYQYTDDTHPATVSDIISYLSKKGIQAVRQTVYGDLDALIAADTDIVVIKSTQNQYFIGSRIFEYPELKMLIDAVASSKTISAKKSEQLIQKLCGLSSEAQAAHLHQLACLSNRIKPCNEKVYYIVDSLQTAILEHHQIQFQYYEYTKEKQKILKHSGYHYIVDPYALEWQNDHYYLIGYSHKHNKVAHFRVDRLAGIDILEISFQPLEDFDVAAYTNKLVEMFAADSAIHVELLCNNELMRVIIDHYGETVPVQPFDEGHFIATIEVNPSGTFYGWVFKFKGKMKILSPQKCVEEMRQIALNFL